jgi:hypothetical protein
MKFLENPHSRRRVFPYRRIDMTILIFVFLGIANASMKYKIRDLIIVVYNVTCDICLFHTGFYEACDDPCIDSIIVA